MASTLTLPETDEPVDVDLFSGLDHKLMMRGTFDHLDPWIPEPDRRRLTAYLLAKGYLHSVSRKHLNKIPNDEERSAAWQEFGDCSVIVNRIAAAVVGEDASVSIEGADAPLADTPDYRPAPTPPDRAAMQDFEYEERLAAFETAKELWRADSQAKRERWEQRQAARPKLLRRQDWLRKWADDEGFIARLVECEKRNVVPLGSGIFVFGWDTDRRRPKVETYEPDSYFPVLDDARPSEYPSKVHLAWGITKGEGHDKKKYVRRITYELVPVEQVERSLFDPSVDKVGYLTDDQEQTHVVLLTDVEIPVEAFRDRSLRKVEDAGEYKTVKIPLGPGPDAEIVEVALKGYPLGYDFIPVLHVTHNLATADHYGTSPVFAMAQLLDELAASDTDESLASRWAARPPAIVSGMKNASGSTAKEKADNNRLEIAPGFWIKGNDNAKVSVIEMASNLAAIGDRIRNLLKRLSVVSEVTEALVGRVDASEVVSGFAAALSFTSFEQMIEGARLARESKYRLGLKWVQRLQLHHGGGFPNPDGEIDEADIEIYPAEVTFGAFMPQDLAGTVDLVTKGVRDKTMSIETAVTMLVAAGSPVEDVATEVAAILSRDSEVAVDIYTATGGDPGPAAAHLQLRERRTDLEPDTPAVDDTEPAGTDVGPGVLANP